MKFMAALNGASAGLSGPTVALCGDCAFTIPPQLMTKASQNSVLPSVQD
jgi:hypothetical protein